MNPASERYRFVTLQDHCSSKTCRYLMRRPSTTEFIIISFSGR
uniref:Uncharacterized protein n=1 Tax=Parascaris equorum TaxID=6256 RepID=A0A914SEE2_PAREQ